MQLEQYIETRQISADFRGRLQRFPRTQLELLCGVLQPSANALKGLLQLVEGIARSRGESLEQVLDDPELGVVLEQEALPRKERLRRYREVLELRRYPEVARVKAQLSDAVAEVLRDCRVRIELPKELEGDALSFSFSARSADELSQYATRFSAAAAHPATQRIYAILQGEYE